MSIIDPNVIGKLRAERDKPSRMQDQLQDQCAPASDPVQRQLNQQMGGALKSIYGLDPAQEAERKAREDRELRHSCLHMATQMGGMPGDVVTRAKTFYDFIKGQP